MHECSIGLKVQVPRDSNKTSAGFVSCHHSLSRETKDGRGIVKRLVPISLDPIETLSGIAFALYHLKKMVVECVAKLVVVHFLPIQRSARVEGSACLLQFAHTLAWGRLQYERQEHNEQGEYGERELDEEVEQLGPVTLVGEQGRSLGLRHIRSVGSDTRPRKARLPVDCSAWTSSRKKLREGRKD